MTTINHQKELDDFIQFSDIDMFLIKNTIEQIGSFETFKESYSYFLKDCFKGINGFMNYSEINTFYIDNQNLIKFLIILYAVKFEYESVYSSLKTLFNVYKINPSEESIWELLLTKKYEYDDEESEIINALVGYMFEMICHSYQDFIDSNKE
jgi:hypothetical protein